MQNADIHYPFMLSSSSVVFSSQVFWWWKCPQERKNESIWHLRIPVPETNTAKSSHLKFMRESINIRRLK